MPTVRQTRQTRQTRLKCIGVCMLLPAGMGWRVETCGSRATMFLRVEFYNNGPLVEHVTRLGGYCAQHFASRMANPNVVIRAQPISLDEFLAERAMEVLEK